MIRALTLTEPWATLVATGKKKIETRGWSTKYRGPLVIHAAKQFDAHHTELFGRNLYLEPGVPWVPKLTCGKALCLVNLTLCVRVEGIRETLSAEEFAYGNYGDGRYAFCMEMTRRFRQPFHLKRALGLWQLDESIIEGKP